MDQESRALSFVRRNPDLISGALIADAMLSLKGEGSHKVLQSVMPAAKSHFDKAMHVLKTTAKGLGPIPKTASAQDYLTNAVVWPLAMGGVGLPGRMVGGLFDQAVLDVSKRILARKKPAQPK